MALNKSKGNMYPFLNDYPEKGSSRGYTWNTIKGKCPHGCEYCYMKQFPQKDVRLDQKEFKTDLGEGNFIFIGSSCDMWADDISMNWISVTLLHCAAFNNRYLFQSKNPKRFYDFEGKFPETTYLGTTIESNRIHPQMGNTPKPMDRAMVLNHHANYFPTMVTVEPIMDFDPLELWNLICICNPEWVNVGADSKGHNLPEPNADKIKELIYNLKDVGIEVKIKSNLKRLIGEFPNA